MGLTITSHNDPKYACVYDIDGLLIKTTIHGTDTITVIVACSCAPVAIDIRGIIRLSSALTRV